MKPLYFLLLLFVSAPSLYAQVPVTFERIYSDNGLVEGFRVRQTYDGGYIVAARRSIPGAWFSNDGTLMKTDSLGNIEWLKVYGTAIDDDWFEDVQQTKDSGFVACGYLPQLGTAEDIHIVKTDKNGDTLWTKIYASSLADYPRSITPTYDGGYAVTGRWADSMGIVLRLDAQGDTLWTKKLYDGYGTYMHSIAQTADSGFVAAGTCACNNYPNMNLQLYALRLDKDGNILWEKNYGYSDADFGHDIKVLPDGNFLLGGYAWLPPNDYESYLLKLDAFGDTLWTKVYSDPRENGIKEIALCQDGGFALGESKSVLGRSYELSVVRTDSLGNFLWRREYGGEASDYMRGITSCRDGGFALCGLYGMWGGPSRLYLIKLNEDGLLSATENYDVVQQAAVKIGPNPFGDELVVDLSGLAAGKNYELGLYHISGQILQSVSTNGIDILQLQTAHLPPGSYFLQIFDGSEVVGVFKLIRD